MSALALLYLGCLEQYAALAGTSAGIFFAAFAMLYARDIAAAGRRVIRRPRARRRATRCPDGGCAACTAPAAEIRALSRDLLGR